MQDNVEITCEVTIVFTHTSAVYVNGLIFHELGWKHNTILFHYCLFWPDTQEQ